MLRVTLIAAAAVVLLASGAVHGLWTDRWTIDPKDTKEAAERLGQLPSDLAKWEGKEIEMNTDPRLGLAGVLARRYVDRESGKVVTIYLACGRPGPVSTHTPDVCYEADGFKGEPPTRVTLPADGTAAPEFWTARFTRQRPDGQTTLRIYWAWHAADGWKAADNPRVAFASEAVLHKLYVIRELVNPNDPAEGDACTEFMRELLPVLEQKLFVK
jgi:hypothetical protein